MAYHPAGIVSDLSAAAATAFHRIELNPVVLLHVTEVGISMNGAPNSTLVPQEFNLQRNTLVGTGAAGTVIEIHSQGTALQATALVENTADGAGTITILHRWFIPVVSGMIWVAAPNREPDCIAAEFFGLKNQAALGTGISATCYLVWEE